MKTYIIYLNSLTSLTVQADSHTNEVKDGRTVLTLIKAGDTIAVFYSITCFIIQPQV